MAMVPPGSLRKPLHGCGGSRVAVTGLEERSPVEVWPGVRRRGILADECSLNPVKTGGVEDL